MLKRGISPWRKRNKMASRLSQGRLSEARIPGSWFFGGWSKISVTIIGHVKVSGDRSKNSMGVKATAPSLVHTWMFAVCRRELLEVICFLRVFLWPRTLLWFLTLLYVVYKLEYDLSRSYPDHPRLRSSLIIGHSFFFLMLSFFAVHICLLFKLCGDIVGTFFMVLAIHLYIGTCCAVVYLCAACICT